jgi:hypothetical protein
MTFTIGCYLAVRYEVRGSGRDLIQITHCDEVGDLVRFWLVRWLCLKIKSAAAVRITYSNSVAFEDLKEA